MTDSNSRRSWRMDRERINVNESYEVAYWTRKFGVTEEQLRTAVRTVLDAGHAPMVDLIAAQLGLEEDKPETD